MIGYLFGSFPDRRVRKGLNSAENNRTERVNEAARSASARFGPALTFLTGAAPVK